MKKLKRQDKRKKLIKDLFEELKGSIIKYNPDNVKIKFRVQKGYSGNSSGVTYWSDKDSDKLDLLSIKLNLYSFKRRYKEGYTDYYYKDRGRFLNNYILHNRKNALKFILLHELAHCKIALHNKTNYSKVDKSNNERLADRIAIKLLNKGT